MFESESRIIIFFVNIFVIISENKMILKKFLGPNEVVCTFVCIILEITCWIYPNFFDNIFVAIHVEAILSQALEIVITSKPMLSAYKGSRKNKIS